MSLLGLKTSDTSKYAESPTIGDLQKVPVSEWELHKKNSDILDGLRFSATMQLRTPLRVLRHHDELFKGSGIPPNYAEESWEGIWLPSIKNEYYLGIDSTMASDIGPIPSDGGNYLQFLLTVRSIVENELPLTERKKCLVEELSKEEWKSIVLKHGGQKQIIDYYFPSFVSILPGLSDETRKLLREKKLITPNAIAEASDNELLTIKGIGPAKLNNIRHIASLAVDKSSDICLNI